MRWSTSGLLLLLGCVTTHPLAPPCDEVLTELEAADQSGFGFSADDLVAAFRAQAGTWDVEWRTPAGVHDTLLITVSEPVSVAEQRLIPANPDGDPAGCSAGDRLRVQVDFDVATVDGSLSAEGTGELLAAALPASGELFEAVFDLPVQPGTPRYLEFEAMMEPDWQLLEASLVSPGGGLGLEGHVVDTPTGTHSSRQLYACDPRYSPDCSIVMSP